MDGKALRKLRQLNSIERGLDVSSEPVQQQNSQQEKEEDGKGLLLRCHVKQSASDCELSDADKVSCNASGPAAVQQTEDINLLKEVIPNEDMKSDKEIECVDDLQMTEKGNVEEVLVEEIKECVKTDHQSGDEKASLRESLAKCSELNAVEWNGNCGLIATDTPVEAEDSRGGLDGDKLEEIVQTERDLSKVTDIKSEEPGCSESSNLQVSEDHETKTVNRNDGVDLQESTRTMNATSLSGEVNINISDTLQSSDCDNSSDLLQSSQDIVSNANHEEVSDKTPDEAQGKNVAQDSNAVYASRDIRYYPCSSLHSMSVSDKQPQDGKQHLSSRGYEAKFRSFSRDSRKPKGEPKTYHEMKTSDASNWRLFVGNLSYKVTVRDMYDYFGQFGSVQDCHIVRHHVTKKSKGFGFVTFNKESTAEVALNSPPEKRTLDGRVMKLSRATPNKQRWLAEASSQGEQIVSKGTTSAVVVDDEDCHIRLLPDEVLAKIFNYVNVRERVLIERVCQRWHTVARASWHSVTHISVHQTFNLWKGQHLTDKVFREILKRGCCELRSIDLSGCPRHLTGFALLLVGAKCKKLTHLDISGVSISKMCLRKVCEDCTKLQWIRLHKCCKVSEKGFWWLFHYCKELQYVDIGCNPRLTGQCFYVVGSQLSTIILSGCTKLTDNGIELLVSRSPNLTELDINKCQLLTDQGIRAIASNCSKLKRLDCSSCGSSVTSCGFVCLSKLLSLEKLYLSQNSGVNDDVMAAIARHCSHLCELDVSSCRDGLTDVGIQCLVGCICLTHLNISYITSLTNEGVSHLAQIQSLKKLIARYCSGITTPGFVAVATLCELEELDVSSCYQLGDVFLEKVTAAKSTNTILLCIHL